MTAMGNWKEQILAYFDIPGGATNAAVEATNGKIKGIARQGRGYSFEVIRAKVLHSKIAQQQISTSLRRQTSQTSSPKLPKLMQSVGLRRRKSDKPAVKPQTRSRLMRDHGVPLSTVEAILRSLAKDGQSTTKSG